MNSVGAYFLALFVGTSAAVAPPNIALGKAVFQSTVAHNGPPTNAVDGKLSQIYNSPEGSCTHTDTSGPGWWAVDLGGFYDVESVTILNRMDCCGDQLATFDIMVGEDMHYTSPDLSSMAECYHQVVAVGAQKTFRCSNGELRGRYVAIRKWAGTVLTLCEVQVFGEFAHAAPPNIALGKDVFQSTVAHNGPPTNAVDGKLSQIYNSPEGSCTHTDGSGPGWWAVDLGGYYDVESVTILNRLDCCGGQLATFDILVAQDLHYTSPDLSSMDECYHQVEPVGAQKTFRCTNGKLRGRYVAVRKRAGTVLTLCEVQVFGNFVHAAPPNIALGKAVFQSTMAHNGPPTNAVDGKLSQIYNSPKGSCTHTDTSGPGWWAVDLGGYYDVESVTILNRLDCCGDQLATFDILVSRDMHPTSPNFNSMTKCYHQVEAVGPQKSFKCRQGKPMGRYVTIRKWAGTVLTLCEVQVFGTPATGTNVALGKHAFQSTTHGSGSAPNAVDGQLSQTHADGSCTHTDNSGPGWWAVDLEGYYDVESVTIFNRVDCCGERLATFDIYVGKVLGRANGNPNRSHMVLCHHQEEAVGSIGIFPCGQPIFGRYVLIQKYSGTVLTLCEVIVQGSQVVLNATTVG